MFNMGSNEVVYEVSPARSPEASGIWTRDGGHPLPGMAPAALGAPQVSSHSTITYQKVQIDSIGVFYREAGPKNAPTIVLLHGFSASSSQFEALIPLLATRYHIIAPDYPGFGQCDAPDPSSFSYTFDHLAKIMDDLLVRLEIHRYSLYIHDYGAPVGFRLMLAHPERVHALITQNGNAYKEGLGKKWLVIAEFWSDPKSHPETIDTFLFFETTMQRHVAGSTHPERYNPDAWLSEFAHLSKPGQRAIRLCRRHARKPVAGAIRRQPGHRQSRAAIEG